MNRRILFLFSIMFLPICVSSGATAFAQSYPSHATLDPEYRELKALVETPAVSGYEGQLSGRIRSELAAFQPQTDNLGDVVITIGSGSPNRLIVAPIDEPGFVVSEITDDGYLCVQRLPQFGLSPMFNELYSAQPVKVRTASGKWIDGVVAGLSVHLQPGHTNPPNSGDLENFYVDIGAKSAAEARRAGVDNLSPLVINRSLMTLGYGNAAGASIGDRFGADALLELLKDFKPSMIQGTLTVAFVVQQYTGARGLERILTTVKADEMIYVGRMIPGRPLPGAQNVRRAPRREPGSGVLLGLPQSEGTFSGFAAALRQLAEANKIPFEADYSGGLISRSYLPSPPMPAKWVHLGIATAWPNTPAEFVDLGDLHKLESLLALYMGIPKPAAEQLGATSFAQGEAIEHGAPTNGHILKSLVETYGVSDHESPVREEVKRLLPAWAKPETDDAENLVLHVGTASPDSKTPSILVVAHMDEIGFEVKSIAKDGRLEVEWKGGGELSFFAGHPALVHTANGDRDAIMELPDGWDTPNFTWPRGPQEPVLRVDVGARTPEEVERLGIKTGDWITIPKEYRTLLGTRANGRSFDDRVGCTALISAVWSLGGPLKGRDVTFVWSTGEELGLNGAAAIAKRLAAEGHAPDYVFAVDTFVSSDSPLESKRFGDAPVGKGFVVRAVDNSNIVPSNLVQRVVKLARTNQIPVQYGVTGGGNDGSAFVRYGSVDVALGWPLRYSHSPAEVIDTRDVDALGRIVAVIAKSW